MTSYLWITELHLFWTWRVLPSTLQYRGPPLPIAPLLPPWLPSPATSTIRGGSGLCSLVWRLQCPPQPWHRSSPLLQSKSYPCEDLSTCGNICGTQRVQNSHFVTKKNLLRYCYLFVSFKWYENTKSTTFVAFPSPINHLTWKVLPPFVTIFTYSILHYFNWQLHGHATLYPNYIYMIFFPHK